MRIIAGRYGSRPLVAPKGSATRPTQDRTRESLFNILTPRLAGARVLDLFSGSGALAFEALSHGAAYCVVCDQAPAACAAIRANADSLQAQDVILLLPVSWERAVRRLQKDGAAFDLIFLDPPYGLDAGPVLARIAAGGLLAQEGMIVLERSWRTAPALPDELDIVRTKRYGDTGIDFIIKKQEQT